MTETTKQGRSQGWYRRLLENIPHIVWVSDASGELTYANRRTVAELGVPPSVVRARRWDLFHPEDVERCRETWRRALETGSPYQHEARIKVREGSYRWFLIRGMPLPDIEGEVEEWVGTLSDIDERKRTEQRHRRDALLLAKVRDAVIVTDLDGNVTYWNQAATRVLGWPEEAMIGEPLGKYLPGPVRVAMVEIARNLIEGELWSGELRIARQDGSHVWVAGRIHCISGADHRPHSLIGLFHDISERKAAKHELERIEEQHRQAQKMEALGQLAGGIAHDFNNLLTVIIGYGEMLGDALADDSPARSAVGEILQASQSAGALIRQLLTFSRRQVVTVETVCLNSIVRQTKTMLRRLIGENIRLRTRLERHPLYVEADSSQMQQVLLNLAINARDAMPEGGELTLETRAVEGGDAGGLAELEKAPWALLSVADTGVGMTEEVQRHVFEPFFTTKELDRGTGLGLAVVYGIVEQSGGHVEVHSEPGDGATFRIYLPRTEEPTEVSKPKPTRSEIAPLARDTTVLLVEDDDGVRTLAEMTLRDAGYRVLVADRAGSALQLATDCEGMIDLLITDVVLPGRNGRALAERLLESYLDLRVLYVSGHVDDAVVRNDVADENVSFLHKPFSPAVLDAKVRQVLSG